MKKMETSAFTYERYLLVGNDGNREVSFPAHLGERERFDRLRAMEGTVMVQTVMVDPATGQAIPVTPLAELSEIIQ